MRARSTSSRYGEGHRARVAPRRGLVDHPLAEQALKGLIDAVKPEITERFRPKAGVNEVHLRVFDATAIEVHVHPTVGDVRVEAHRLVLGVHKAHEVPRRVNEGVHRVGLPSCGFTARGAIHLKE